MKKYRTTAAVFRQFMEDEYRFTGTRFTTSDIMYRVRKRRSTSELADRLCNLVNMEEYIRGRVRAMLKSGHLQVVPDGKTRNRRYILTDDHWFGEYVIARCHGGEVVEKATIGPKEAGYES